MGTGLTCGFATASDRGRLQRAPDTLDEEIAKTLTTPFHQHCPHHNVGRSLLLVGAPKRPSAVCISPKSLPFFSEISPRRAVSWRATG